MTTIFPEVSGYTSARTTPRLDAARRIARFAAHVMACIAVARERQVLARLEPHQLADAGISPAEANREIARGFWDIPPGRIERR